MKLIHYSVLDQPPIKKFQISDLANVVVLAGPNGIGKTSLLVALLNAFRNPGSANLQVSVAATCQEEITAWGGRTTLDSSNSDEAGLLRRYLQRSQKRGQLRGGVLNFDSGRSFEQIKPYAFTWSTSDPYDEDIGWDAGFSSMKGRFQDVVHSLFRKVRSQKEEIAKRAVTMRQRGETIMPLDFGDPLERFKSAFARLLPGKTLLDVEEQGQTLKYLQDGQTLELVRLSSGEREVVTVVFDFLLRNPSDCIVVFDEPELHLHPELSFRLIRTLQDAGARNQFIFCTHSPDIISASLDQTVVFVGPPRDPAGNQAIRVSEGDAMSEVLRSLGQSVGVISLGKKIVLIEGDRTSLDKQVYGSILGNAADDLVLVPVGGKDKIAAFQIALGDVLNRTVWGVDFFMLCDGDSNANLSRAVPDESRSRLRRLRRYHLENYFLDETIIAAVAEKLAFPQDSPWRQPTYVRGQMLDAARGLASMAVTLRVSQQFRDVVGNLDVAPKGTASGPVDELVASFNTRREAEVQRIMGAVEAPKLELAIRESHELIMRSLESGSDTWKHVVPGRPIAQQVAKQMGVSYGVFKQMYIQEAQNAGADPFLEVKQIFADFRSL